MEKKKEILSWFCTDLEAWDWDRHLGESAWSRDRGVLGVPMSLFALTLQLPPEPSVGTRRRQFVLFREVQLCQDKKSLWRLRGCALGLLCGNWHSSPGWRSRAGPWTRCS